MQFSMGEYTPINWRGFGPYRMVVWDGGRAVHVWAWRRREWVKAVAWDAWVLSTQPGQWPTHFPWKLTYYALHVPSADGPKTVTAWIR